MNGGHRGHVPQICNLSSQMGGKSHTLVIIVKTYPSTHRTRERAGCNTALKTAEKGMQTVKETIKAREHKEPCKYTSINSLCISDEEIQVIMLLLSCWYKTPSFPVLQQRMFQSSKQCFNSQLELEQTQKKNKFSLVHSTLSIFCLYQLYALCSLHTTARLSFTSTRPRKLGDSIHNQTPQCCPLAHALS